MIIVSQDKETIMNFDNSTTIRLYKYSTGYEIEACLTNGHISTLGNYATKEYIRIDLGREMINLPKFDSGSMYKGMKLNKGYTLEELGL